VPSSGAGGFISKDSSVYTFCRFHTDRVVPAYLDSRGVRRGFGHLKITEVFLILVHSFVTHVLGGATIQARPDYR